MTFTPRTPRDVEKHLKILNVLNKFSEGSDKVSIGRPHDVRKTEKINVDKASSQDVHWTSKHTFRRRTVNVGLLSGDIYPMQFLDTSLVIIIYDGFLYVTIY